MKLFLGFCHFICGWKVYCLDKCGRGFKRIKLTVCYFNLSKSTIHYWNKYLKKFFRHQDSNAGTSYPGHSTQCPCTTKCLFIPNRNFHLSFLSITNYNHFVLDLTVLFHHNWTIFVFRRFLCHNFLNNPAEVNNLVRISL